MLTTFATTSWYIIRHKHSQRLTRRFFSTSVISGNSHTYKMATATNSTFYELYRSSSYVRLILKVRQYRY